MKRPVDPPRLLDDASGASDAMRELVASTRGDEPTADQVSDVTARLAHLLGPFGAPPSGSSPTEPDPPAPAGDSGSSAAASSTLLRKLALPGLVLGLISAGAAMWWSGSERSEARSLGRSGRGLELHSSAMQTNEPSVDQAPNPAPSGSVSHRATPVPSASAGDHEDELALLRRAHAALRGGDGSSALGLTYEHARRFPRSALSQEREVIAIEALVRLGRRGEAERRGQRFLSGHSQSTHARRVAAILGKDLDAGAAR